MHFQHTFWLQRTSCPWLINTIFLREYFGLVIKCTKSHQPNRCIKVSNKPPKTALFVVHTNFFCNQTWPCHSVTLSSDFSLYEQTLFNYSNTQSEQRIHFPHNPFFIHPATRNATPRLEQWSKTKATCSYFASLVSFNYYISTLVLLFCTRLFHHLFSMCYTFQTDNYKTAPSNSLERCFHLEIDTVFYSCIDHGFRYNSLLEFIKRYSGNYRKVILLNLKMSNYVLGYLFLLK